MQSEKNDGIKKGCYPTFSLAPQLDAQNHPIMDSLIFLRRLEMFKKATTSELVKLVRARYAAGLRALTVQELKALLRGEAQLQTYY